MPRSTPYPSPPAQAERADAQSARLLAADEPAAFTVEHPEGRSPFFLTCDHAGRRLPRRLGNLGLPAAELERHIAWDIGAAALSRRLAEKLDAFLILQTYSRLVIDCNRAPGVPTSIVALSEHTAIPGNQGLGAAEAAARVREIFEPYHGRIVAALDRRKQAGEPTVLLAMHSFTPVFKGVARPWHVGVLYNRDPAFGRIMGELLRAEGDLVVGDNEPYAISDETDYTIPVHGEKRGLAHVEFEIRQDLIAEPSGQLAWAERLARLLPLAYRRLQHRGDRS
jgi:predicted N-formylglutamate amidohydrolase